MATVEEMRKAARDLRAQEAAREAEERAEVQRKSEEINAVLLANEIHRMKGEPLEEVPHQPAVDAEEPAEAPTPAPAAATPPPPPVPAKDPAPIDEKAGK